MPSGGVEGGEGGALDPSVQFWSRGMADTSHRAADDVITHVTARRTRTGPNGPWETGAAFDRRCPSHPSPVLVTGVANFKVGTFRHRVSSLSSRGSLSPDRAGRSPLAAVLGLLGVLGPLRRQLSRLCLGLLLLVSIRTRPQTASHAGGHSFPVWIVLLVLFGARVGAHLTRQPARMLQMLQMLQRQIM